mmetsp:Transcript_105194/g.339307  ORF Transcript_105194/g.339307 Transcript_105194/m.339307 type:complete len:243 (+) Transcript_105194:1202-1930(+)
MLSACARSPSTWQSTPQSPSVSAISGCCQVLYFCSFSSRHRFCRRSDLQGSRSKARAWCAASRSMRWCCTLIGSERWPRSTAAPMRSAVSSRLAAPRRARQLRENSATASASRSFRSVSMPPARAAPSWPARPCQQIRAAAQCARRNDLLGSAARDAAASSMSAVQTSRWCVEGLDSSAASAAGAACDLATSGRTRASKAPSGCSTGRLLLVAAAPQTSTGSMLLPWWKTQLCCWSHGASGR